MRGRRRTPDELKQYAVVGPGLGPLTQRVDVDRAQHRPAPAIARWGLETYPGVDADAALSDTQPVSGNTGLTATGTTWTDKARLVGAGNATFSGSGVLTTSGPVVDTTKNYAVAAWVKLDQLTSIQNIVSQDGAHTANFQLQYRNDDRNGDGTADKSWCFFIRSSDTDAITTGGITCGVNTATAGRWTHVAGGYDAAEQKMRIWVDGVLVGEATAPTAWSGTGPLRIGNRKYTSTSYLDNLYGSVADVQVYDRILVQNDFTGQLASDPQSGGVDEPGMLEPIMVDRWDFEAAAPCYDPAVPDTCEAPDLSTPWGRRLALTQGTDIGSGALGLGASFDNTALVADPADPNPPASTREYGTSQRNTAAAGETPQWQDSPALRTDQSFTVSVWVHPDDVSGTMTAVAPKGSKQSAFYLGIRNSTVNGVAGRRFEAMTVSADQDLGETYTHLIAPQALEIDETGAWTQLTLVYDTSARQLGLYVNGDLAATTTQNSMWNAAGPLIVGSSWWSADNTTGGWYDPWFGGIDELTVYQGAMTSAQVAIAYDQQATPVS